MENWPHDRGVIFHEGPFEEVGGSTIYPKFLLGIKLLATIYINGLGGSKLFSKPQA